jgi:ATP-dependent Clp protease adaptor protein ClpS
MPSTTPVALPEQETRTLTLPPWKVLLHNDDVNDFEHVIVTILKLTPLNEAEAIERTIEAHERGLALLLVTGRERAELYVEQFASCKLTVTCEPAD